MSQPDRPGPHEDSRRAGATGPDSLGPLLSRLCSRVADELDLAGVVVMIMASDAAQAVVGSSGDGATALAQISLATGEGPTLDAFTLRRPVIEGDLADTLTRWPGYATEALRAGACSAFAFPLQLGAARFGVLTCWDRRTRRLAPDEIAALLAHADRATQVLLDPARNRSAEDGTTQVDHAIHLPHEVYQAQGMGMVQLGVTLAEALARIRGHAFATGQDLTTLARSIVDGQTRIDDDPPT